ncbi:MAG: thioesterase [Oscillospiraceae bacterium]|nr:thioesterase [Oscillospiraceae bacterium]
MEILKRDIAITASDIDCHRQIRPSALLGYLQNLATDHAEVLGFGGDCIEAEYGAVWMMVRMDVRLTRPIAYDEALEIHTWHRGAPKSSVMVLRDFEVFAGGALVGEATMAWILADIASRRIMKPGKIQRLADSPRPERIKETIPAKIQMPDGLTKAMTRTIVYSDTDINGHMNNTKYADIACDAIRYEGIEGRFIAGVQINYLHECFPGDEIEVLCREVEDAHYVRGADFTGKSRFEVCLTLQELT